MLSLSIVIRAREEYGLERYSVRSPLSSALYTPTPLLYYPLNYGLEKGRHWEEGSRFNTQIDRTNNSFRFFLLLNNFPSPLRGDVSLAAWCVI